MYGMPALVARYAYDTWGRILSVTDGSGNPVTDPNHIANVNPIRYRCYYYDAETGLYYLQSRYYDPTVGRFVNADAMASTGQGLTATNMFAYCGNNPVNRTDTTGTAWWHWAIAGVVVVACAVAVVATAGTAAAGIAAVMAVGNGVAAATTSSTIAAAAFIGSATYLGASALDAAGSSGSVQDFADQGNWGAVAGTVGSGVISAGAAYLSTRTQSKSSTSSEKAGKAFNPQGPKVQEGVDPKTLNPSKDLKTLDPVRLKNAELYGRDQALTVTRAGIILDGNHRLANAIAQKRAVDVVIFPN